MTKAKLVVDKRVLMKRLQRALAERGQKLVVTKKSAAVKGRPSTLAVLSKKTGAALRTDVTLGTLARELKVLKPHETPPED